MTAFRPQQRHLTIQGRRFHFVSYEGRPANHRRAQLAYPAMWYLMVEGRRRPVLPCGGCRQVLMEQAPDLVVVLERPDGSPEEIPLRDLLPRPFTGDDPAS